MEKKLQKQATKVNYGSAKETRENNTSLAMKISKLWDGLDEGILKGLFHTQWEPGGDVLIHSTKPLLF